MNTKADMDLMSTPEMESEIVRLRDLLRWRKCSEEMPAIHEPDVFEDFLTISHDPDSELSVNENPVQVFQFVGGVGWYDIIDDRKIEGITHWRPIGPLPEGGEG